MQLNEQQLAAVNEPPKNITVSAAAGSGKTQVLGARVLRRISGDDPVDVNRLLIVTFTRAAAAEMRSRINRYITEELKNETDQKRRKNLERQLSLLGGADICTIDSFCFRLLKQNFFRVPGLAPDFSVGAEASVRDISSEALRQAVEMFSSALEESRGGELAAHYRKRAGEFRGFFPEEERALLLEGYALLSENYGSAKRTNDFVTDDKSRRGEDYIEFVRGVKRVLSSVADPEKWLRDRAADYDASVPFDRTALGRYAAERAAGLIEDISKKLSDELKGGLNPNNAATFSSTLENIGALPKPRTYTEAAELFSRPFPSGGRVQSKDTKNVRGDPGAAKVMDDAKSIWKKAAALYAASAEKIEIFRKRFRPAALALLGLTRLTLSLEREKMLEKKRLSFSACVGLALELLTEENSETAAELREYYDEIYVDEAQDIDPRQLAIFEAISRNNLFMVGDVKQSIYGFRQAEPEIFGSRCRDGGDSRLVSMNVNYRSSGAVIGAVNQVFGRLMNDGTMGLDYADHRMERGESWLPEPTRAEFLAVVDEEKSHLTYKADEEAQAVADRIIELIDSRRPVYDGEAGARRPIRYRDIMVLFRANRDGPVLERILSENGIPCYLDGGRGLYLREEITAVADVLRLIDDPFRDMPLTATLRGLMFGFGDNDLLRIRSVSANHEFSRVFAVICDPEAPRHGEYAARLNDGELLGRCMDVGALLKKWRLMAAFRPVTDVIEAIINDTGYYASVGALPSGAARRANLELLIDAAAEFEAGGSRGLYSFINHIERQELSGGGEQTEAKTLSDAMDVVRLMTVHKSKGLEAPAVFLFRCPAPFGGGRGALALSRELGFSADYINEEKGYRYKSPLSPLIELESRGRERAEEIRLLYVAMTRAREILVCTGYFPNQAALDRALSFKSELTLGDVTFLADSYAKLLGASITDGRFWRMETVAAADVTGPRPSRLMPSAPAFSEDVLETAGGLLGFNYEFSRASEIPAKVSVSALKAGDYDEDAPPAELISPPARRLKTPAFLDGEERVSGAELGTAYHTVMESLDLDAPVTPQIDMLEKSGIISPALRKLIRDERITALLDGPLGRRMRSARRLWREAPFMISVPAEEALGPGVPSGERVAVQGIIDCFFEEDDRVVLVDYKTDSYTAPSEIAEKYKAQLNYYEKALKMKFSDKKIQKYLYLFHKGDIIEV